MDEKKPENRRDHGADAEDVEILEVVGFVEEGTTLPSSAETTLEEEVEPDDEYVLDFDDADHDLLAEEAAARGVVGAREALDDEGDEDSAQQRLLRLRADYDNLRKRIDRERREFEIYANTALVGRLLPFLDNLERALAVESTGESDGPLREGLIMMHRQLIDQLRREGLQEIQTTGQPFDPNLHDAVATAPESTEPANTIVEEMQKGYLFQDRVLRPAMVRVSTGLHQSEGDES